jgi:hypothetical protein
MTAQHFDENPWIASLGDRRSFVGLYMGRRRVKKTQQWETEMYMVCSAGLDAATYVELETYLSKCEKEKKSMKEVFIHDRVLCRARRLAKRNRRRLLFSAASLLGCTINSRADAMSKDEVEMACIDIETESCMVKAMGDNLVFFNGVTCTEDVKGGLLLERAPQTGPLILYGPTTSSGRSCSWTNPHYGGFPASLGIKAGEVGDLVSEQLTADGDLSQHSYLNASFRERDSSWVQMEQKLGYHETRWPDPLDLQPVASKFGPPTL